EWSESLRRPSPRVLAGAQVLLTQVVMGRGACAFYCDEAWGRQSQLVRATGDPRAWCPAI
ncbi:MAG: hypothetical protein ACO32I_08895, partial [Candidatus Limnocylindrus sp.]